MLANHKDDRRRIEKSLEACGIAGGKGDYITPDKFSFEAFYSFYRHLTARSEIEQV